MLMAAGKLRQCMQYSEIHRDTRDYWSCSHACGYDSANAIRREAHEDDSVPCDANDVQAPERRITAAGAANQLGCSQICRERFEPSRKTKEKGKMTRLIISLIFLSIGCALPPSVRQNRESLSERWKREDVERAKHRDERRSNYLAEHSELSESIRKSILSGTPSIGMDKEQVTAVMGEPSKINRTVTAFGTSEQWIYGKGTYLYFDSGILTSWQE